MEGLSWKWFLALIRSQVEAIITAGYTVHFRLAISDIPLDY